MTLIWNANPGRVVDIDHVVATTGAPVDQLDPNAIDKHEPPAPVTQGSS